MTISDWILIISAILVISGWFVNSELNRRHEIAKKRLDYRLDMLLAFIEVFLQMTSSKNPFVEHKNLPTNMADARKKFQLYGKDDEVKMFEEFVTNIESGAVDATNESLKKLIDLVKR